MSLKSGYLMINGHKHKIIYVEKVEEETGNENTIFAGRTQAIELTIEIVKGFPRSRRNQVLIHEVLHAIENTSGVGPFDEQTIETLAMSLNSLGFGELLERTVTKSAGKSQKTKGVA